MEEVKKFAKSIAFQAPLAVKSIMEAVVDGAAMPLEEGLALESSLFGGLCETEDKNEGLTAFLEKRKPVFKGK